MLCFTSRVFVIVGKNASHKRFVNDLKSHSPVCAVRSYSAHESKIIVFERFHCSLTKINQLN